MTPLPLQFHRSTFIYRQVCRFGDVALYRKAPAYCEGQEKLEVVRVASTILADISFSTDPNNKEIHQRLYRSEVYPLAGDYGKHLWDVADEAEAFGLMAVLLLNL